MDRNQANLLEPIVNGASEKTVIGAFQLITAFISGTKLTDVFEQYG